jgi:hypothetical protein
MLKEPRRRCLVAWVNDILLHEVIDGLVFHRRLHPGRESFKPGVRAPELDASGLSRSQLREIRRPPTGSSTD